MQACYIAMQTSVRW